MTRAQFIILGISAVIVVLIILLAVGVIPGLRSRAPEQISGTINFWGVYDSQLVMRELISGYQAIRPRVKVNYTELNPATYENELIDAMASSRGPDLFMVHNTWIPKHFAKITPLLPEQFSPAKFRELFPAVVEQDFAPNQFIFAFPLYLDTLATFYNKDTFDQKAIAIPPKNWKEFQELIPKIREMDRSGKIVKAAAAIGGSGKSVDTATDILNLLMLQTGTRMVSDDFSRATFAEDGQQALEFYTQFANPKSRYFTWQDSLPFSLDGFAQGNTAMMFNYASAIPALKQKNPFLRFGTLPMIQPSESSMPVNYADYWGVAASVKSRNPLLAWDFAVYLTTNLDAQKRYSQLTQKPPALRTLINENLNDEFWGIFARQALTARSWPRIDGPTIKEIFSNMIENVLIGRFSPEQSIREAESQVTALMQRRR